MHAHRRMSISSSATFSWRLQLLGGMFQYRLKLQVLDGHSTGTARKHYILRNWEDLSKETNDRRDRRSMQIHLEMHHVRYECSG